MPWCDKNQLVGPEHIANTATALLPKFVQYPLVWLVVDDADHGARPTTIFLLNVVGHPMAPCRSTVVSDFVANLELGRHTGTGFFLRFTSDATGPSSRQCEHWRHCEYQPSMSRSMNRSPPHLGQLFSFQVTMSAPRFLRTPSRGASSSVTYTIC